MTIVMGLDQHRAQITAEWMDTETGEVMRSRISPAHRAGVGRFCERFRGQELEVALEATTGWRFVADEFRRVGASVHLAEPAETAAMRGNKRRAKTDRADARHIRELLAGGRLPESWIPPGHILDLRARVRLRHTLSHQRGEWQQRIQAVLYHHGYPQRGNLITSEGRSWLATQSLSVGAREQVTIAVSVIDALDAEIVPLEKELRSFARRQAGCKALMGQFGVGELTAVTILAELGDAQRFSSSRDAVRFAGLDITVHQSDQRRAAGHLSRQGPPALRWALFEASMCAARACSPDYEYYSQAAERLGSNRARLSVARKILKRSYHLLRELGEEALASRMNSQVRARLFVTQMRRGRLHARSCRHARVDGPYRPSGRNASPSGITPPTIMSPAQGSPGPSTEIRLSARAHTTNPIDRAHGPPAPGDRSPIQTHATPRDLRRDARTDMERGIAPTEVCPPEIRSVGHNQRRDGADDRDRGGHTQAIAHDRRA